MHSIDRLRDKITEFELIYYSTGLSIVALNQCITDMQSCCDSIHTLLGEIEKETLNRWQDMKMEKKDEHV